MDLAEAAEELYGLPPEEFVPRRTELAKQARADGDKALAQAVQKLPKPTTAAWAVNMLVRHEPDQVAQVLDLGAALREAQESMAGEQLRELGRQRRQLTAAVTRQARGLAAELGQKVGEPVAAQVEETLHAAMVDPVAADAVRTGLLIRPLAVSGTDVADVGASVAVPEAIGATAVRRTARPARGRGATGQGAGEPDGETGERPELSVVPDSSRAIEEAEADLQQAERQLQEAERRLAKARRRVEKREAKGLQLQAEVDELRRRVAEVETQLEDNEDDLSDAEETRDEREAVAAAARDAVQRAREALNTLR